jgi:hypothetical protein
MTFNVSSDLDKVAKVGNMVNSISYALETPQHINEVVLATNSAINAAFITHMSGEAFNDPKKFHHMYEWGRTGDPNSKLWKHVLRGSGAARTTAFEFVASKKSVPISPEKAAVGVQRNHIFVWKAPVMELGLPVRIYPKIAKKMVIDSESGGLIYTDKVIDIPRQGTKDTWNSFTDEFLRWYMSGIPNKIIKSIVEPRVNAAARKAIASGVKASIKKKSFEITPVGIDKNFIVNFNSNLRASYITAARNRRVE